MDPQQTTLIPDVPPVPRIPAQLAPALEIALRDGRSVSLRPLSRGDARAQEGLFAGLSARSRQLRFASPMPRLGPALLAFLGAVDGESHRALGAFDGTELVAVGRLVRTAPWRPGAASAAEVSLTVADAWQGAGLGRALLAALARHAAAAGIEEVGFAVAGDNRAMLGLLATCGLTLRWSAGLGEASLAPERLAEALGRPRQLAA